MTELEKSMECLIVIFHRYAQDKKVLNKKGLKTLIEKELPNFHKTNPDVVDCLMKDLDQNKDDVLDFEEFVPFLTTLTATCEKCYSKKDKK